jgi:uncharacterized protein involved in cysteine biosynthesis
MNLLAPSIRAIAQLDDPVFLGVVMRSLGLALLTFVLLLAGVVWGAHALLADQGWWSWLGELLGGIGALVLALFLFLPLATTIAALFVDRVADAVERRFYVWLPPPHRAPMGEQIWDGIALGARVLGMQVIALLVALLLPGAGIVVAWLISAWAIGRGVFVAVAMRRVGRATANALYRSRRSSVLAQGAVMTAGSLMPLLNLLVPVLCTAAMVHVLHQAGPAREPRAS